MVDASALPSYVTFAEGFLSITPTVSDVVGTFAMQITEAQAEDGTNTAVTLVTFDLVCATVVADVAQTLTLVQGSANSYTYTPQTDTGGCTYVRTVAMADASPLPAFISFEADVLTASTSLTEAVGV